MRKLLVRVLLLAFLAYSVVLYRWAERGDPRFFSVLASPPGRWLKKVFRWQGGSAIAPSSAMPEKLTSAEENYRAMVERDFRETPRAPGAPTPRAVRYKDIELKRRFSDFVAATLDEVTVFSPRNVNLGAESILSTLRRESKELEIIFRDLIDPSKKDFALDLVLFNDEATTLKFFADHRMNVENSRGVYDSTGGVVFATDPRGVEADRLEEVMTTLRHESAHAFFYGAGIHSTTQAESNWLVEGLAVYSQGERVGEPSAAAATVLQTAHTEKRLLPLRALLGIRHSEGLMSLGDEARIEIAYLQAWALVDLLMTSSYRERFFAYLRFVRDPASLSEVATGDAHALFLRRMAMTETTMEEAYLAHILGMAKLPSAGN